MNVKILILLLITYRMQLEAAIAQVQCSLPESMNNPFLGLLGEKVDSYPILDPLYVLTDGLNSSIKLLERDLV